MVASGRCLRLALCAGLGLLAAHVTSGQTCPEGNLVEEGEVQANGYRGDLIRANDGWLVVESTAWDTPEAVLLAGPAAWLQVDLGESTSIAAVLVQADANDAYVVEGSPDGRRWDTLWTAPSVHKSGLATRFARLDDSGRVRFLRVRGNGGDGAYAVAELQAWCRAPEPWPPPMRFRASVANAGLVDLRFIVAVKLVLAIVGMLLFLWGLVLRRADRSEVDRRLRSGILLGLGLAAGLAWWNLGRFHFGSYVNMWELYHYYVGAKYHVELGHTRLYTCTTLADHEDGLIEQVRGRRLRDLATNDITSTAAVLSDPAACKSHFTNESWRDFTHDVRWFRERFAPPQWERIFGDHGYNATPVWSLAGRGLVRLAPASSGAILALTLVDPLLLLVMWAVVWWAFGWQSTAVALLWWGTNMLSSFAWTGGGFLRQDWLLLAIAGICLVRKGWPAAGGAALTWATLLRVFPGFIVFALVLKVIVRMVRQRRFVIEPAQRRFAAGCVATVLVLVPLSLVMPGGVDAWGDFVDVTLTSVRSTGTNVVGMMSVLSYEPHTWQEVMRNPLLEDPFRDWLRSKREVFGERRPVFWVLLLCFLALLGRAVRDEEDWVALALGIGLIPIAAFPACYYFSVFLGLGLLWSRLRFEVGVLLCALSIHTHVTYLAWPTPIEMDQRFAWNSLAVVVTVVWLTVLVVRRPLPTD